MLTNRTITLPYQSICCPIPPPGLPVTACSVREVWNAVSAGRASPEMALLCRSRDTLRSAGEALRAASARSPSSSSLFRPRLRARVGGGTAGTPDRWRGTECDPNAIPPPRPSPRVRRRPEAWGSPRAVPVPGPQQAQCRCSAGPALAAAAVGWPAAAPAPPLRYPRPRCSTGRGPDRGCVPGGPQHWNGNT